MGCPASYCYFKDPVEIWITTKRPGYTRDSAREAVVRLTVPKATTIASTTAPETSSEASTWFTTEDRRSKPARIKVPGLVKVYKLDKFHHLGHLQIEKAVSNYFEKGAPKRNKLNGGCRQRVVTKTLLRTVTERRLLRRERLWRRMTKFCSRRVPGRALIIR